MKTGQNHEVDFARVVIICGPGLGKMMGALHPAGSLYERPTNILKVDAEFKGFRRALEATGVTVYDVRDVLAMDCVRSVRARLDLEDLAAKYLTYTYDESTCKDLNTDSETMHYVGEEYKRTVIEEMSVGQLVSIVLTKPTVTLKKSYRDTGFTATYSFEPLSNINFTRDQQITTRRGIVMGRLRSEQRYGEVDVLHFCHRKLGLEVVGQVQAPGYLEGGDFFPAGEQLCFIGVGPRSNFEAVQYMMENDLFGTERVAVVRDEFERSQERMHLDTVFNILDVDCCLMLQDMMGESSPTRRLVDEYARDSQAASGYRLVRDNVEFSEYVREQGYNIIPISGQDQLKYGCNVLNLGGGHIIAVHKKTARDISRSPHFRGFVQHIEFESVCAMFGAVHCASQVVFRGESPLEAPQQNRDVSVTGDLHSAMIGLTFNTLESDSFTTRPQNGFNAGASDSLNGSGHGNSIAPGSL
mmetsp:Transcript_13253/g.35640  ORF Transcript_13253/g.35640 Transcript_13253/m.35640 type:complete len:470 (-) Transcript_13253:1644-3053(-)